MKILLAMDSRISNEAAIGLLDPHRGCWDRFEVIQIEEPFKRRGFRGAARVGDRLYAVNSAALYALQLSLEQTGGPLATTIRTFRRPEWELGERAAADLHDVHYSPERDRLFVANSSMDCIDELSLSGELLRRRYLWDISPAVAEIAYSRQPNANDLTHVNHISEHNRQIYLTLGNWNGTRTGKIVRYDDGQVILESGLEVPHDGFFHDGRFYLSNSGTSEILIYEANDDASLQAASPTRLPVHVLDDAWLGSFQWVRGIAVTERHIIAGVTQWRNDTADRSQLPPRLVFFDRDTYRFLGEMFLPPVDGFKVPCIFTIFVQDDGSGEEFDYSTWKTLAPAPPTHATADGSSRRHIETSSLLFNSRDDRSTIAPIWSLAGKSECRARVMPGGGLWIDASLPDGESCHISTHPGPLDTPPRVPLTLPLTPSKQYELSVLRTAVRGTLALEAWVIQYGDKAQLCHAVKALDVGENRLGFTLEPECWSLCFAFRISGHGVGHLSPIRLFQVEC